ncbi:MAG: hypothetical protein ACD_3C00111G0026 [uncultured bacterium (gcode 4)]|uniref:VWFA domain-containing protein n=1 Tax=uncultured bacterium (gcode 4) TaxID=1234023 RepID=K2GCQ7_9BACT|nr:MAG: hypothetical protein ACD_3C00111G0026 [uncultured bacterium (gcode 4)]
MKLFWFELLYPLFLWLLALLPVIAFIEFRSLRFWLKSNISSNIKSSKIPTFNFLLRLILKSVAFIIFVLILTNPGYTHVQTEESRKWIDIVLLLDVSTSMLAEDMEPNRIEAAKWVIKDFVSKLVSDRLAFILFAWKPFVSIPLTFDYDYISSYVSTITTMSINQRAQYLDFDWVLKNLSWTSIWDALIMWTDALIAANNWDTKREKAIILITDWAAETWIHPKIAVKYVIEKWIKIYSIWMWKKEWAPLCITNALGVKDCLYDTDTWLPRIVKVDEEMLNFLSASTWWKSYSASSNDALQKIFNDLSKLNKSEIKVKEIKSFLPAYPIFLISLLAILSILSFLEFKTRLNLNGIS